MVLGDAARHREAEAEAARLVGQDVAALPEHLGDVRQVVGGNADAGVLDAHLDQEPRRAAPAAPSPHGCRPAVELDGVLDHRPQRRLQLVGVAGDLVEPGGDLDLDGQLALLRSPP